MVLSSQLPNHSRVVFASKFGVLLVEPPQPAIMITYRASQDARKINVNPHIGSWFAFLANVTAHPSMCNFLW